MHSLPGGSCDDDDDDGDDDDDDFFDFDWTLAPQGPVSKRIQRMQEEKHRRADTNICKLEVRSQPSTSEHASR